jgi:hypothetical protein
MEEETSYKDFETSEPSLRLLEHKIHAFHIKYGKGEQTKCLPPLKRYKLDVSFLTDSIFFWFIIFMYITCIKHNFIEI